MTCPFHRTLPSPLPSALDLSGVNGWSAYGEYRQCRHRLCGAHLLRELVYVEEVSTDQWQWVKPFVKLLLEMKAATRRARAVHNG